MKQKLIFPDLAGVDWDWYYTRTALSAAHQQHYDYAEMLSEMLGEMKRLAHRSYFTPQVPRPEQTASLGVLYDYSHDGMV